MSCSLSSLQIADSDSDTYSDSTDGEIFNIVPLCFVTKITSCYSNCIAADAQTIPSYSLRGANVPPYTVPLVFTRTTNDRFGILQGWVVSGETNTPDHATLPRLQTAAIALILFCMQCGLFCSVLWPSSIRGLATPWTNFLHLSLSSVIMNDSSTGSPVHVLMLSIQAVRGLSCLRAPGIVSSIISFSRQLPCFLMVWP